MEISGNESALAFQVLGWAGIMGNKLIDIRHVMLSYWDKL